MENVYQIIPLENVNDRAKEIDNKVCFIIPISLITKLEMFRNHPIKNKTISILNILSFLNWVDQKIQDDYISISSLKLSNFFPKNHVKKYMDILKELNIISRVPYENGTFYKKGEYSSRYRLFNEYKNDDNLCIIYFLKNGKTEIKIEDNGICDKRMIYTLTSKIDVDYKSALKDEVEFYINGGCDVNALRKRISKLFSLNGFRYIKKGFRVDRIYHSLSNLSKISRKHLTIKMNNIDLKNSQPIFLISYLKSNDLEYDLNYQKDCEDGILYNNFYDLPNESKIRNKDNVRDIVKENFYKNIFFGFNERSIYNKKFKLLYPKTWKSIECIFDSDISLACVLQNREAELFNNLKPNRSKYFFTLFDAIYFNEEVDLSELLIEINKFFTKDDIKVKTEITLK